MSDNKRFRMRNRRTSEDILGGLVPRDNAHLYGIASDTKTLDDLAVGESLVATIRTEFFPEPVEVIVIREE